MVPLRRPPGLLVFGGWSSKQAASETLRFVKQHVAQLRSDLDMEEAFIPGGTADRSRSQNHHRTETRRLIIFAALLLVVFFGFAVAFSLGLGTSDKNFVTIPGSFLVLFFLLIDGYSIDVEWFRPGKDQVVTLIFLGYIALIYFVLLNIFVAIVLDTFSLASRLYAVEANKKNPMIVFLHTYYNWMKGQSLVKDEAEEHMNPKDLSITLDLLPGLVRRKWVEKKRRMQYVADQNFAGMDLFPEDVDRSLSKKADNIVTDWMLPSTQSDVFDQMTAPIEHKPLALYDIPPSVMKQEISRAQLQRLMDEDSTIPLLLGSKRAVDVIRKFKSEEREESGNPVSAVKSMQGTIFARIDKLERVKLDDDVPEVPEISQVAEQMSGAILDLRNQFRVQLTGVIECTAVLFEHLVELTQGLDEVRQNSDGVLQLVRNNKFQETGLGDVMLMYLLGWCLGLSLGAQHEGASWEELRRDVTEIFEDGRLSPRSLGGEELRSLVAEQRLSQLEVAVWSLQSMELPEVQLAVHAQDRRLADLETGPQGQDVLQARHAADFIVEDGSRMSEGRPCEPAEELRQSVAEQRVSQLEAALWYLQRELPEMQGALHSQDRRLLSLESRLDAQAAQALQVSPAEVVEEALQDVADAGRTLVADAHEQGEVTSNAGEEAAGGHQSMRRVPAASGSSRSRDAVHGAEDGGGPSMSRSSTSGPSGPETGPETSAGPSAGLSQPGPSGREDAVVPVVPVGVGGDGDAGSGEASGPGDGAAGAEAWPSPGPGPWSVRERSERSERSSERTEAAGDGAAGLAGERETDMLHLSDHQGTSVHQAAMVLLAEVVDASPKSDTFYSPWVETVPQVEALIAAHCETVEFCPAAFASAGRAREGDFGGGAPSMNPEAPEARPVWLCDTWREVVAEPTRGALCRAIRCQTKRTVLRHPLLGSCKGIPAKFRNKRPNPRSFRQTPLRRTLKMSSRSPWTMLCCLLSAAVLVAGMIANKVMSAMRARCQSSMCPKHPAGAPPTPVTARKLRCDSQKLLSFCLLRSCLMAMHCAYCEREREREKEL
ncbi:pkd2 [Symbiodinium necroappetens]|uniref:Pkd2 protein n=1 Tax=Symbiodinium necroappetens TaxID=1628268 RepID=A0A812XWC2_9DINO|nr:pkd2 [Symbiodinium necroappetens]